VAVITAHGNINHAVEALKSGAFDFVSKPLKLRMLRDLVEAALKLSPDKPQQQERRSRHKLLGDTKAIQALRGKITKLSRSQAPVYVSGESGTGKELVARLIHELGSRKDGPFVPINCGAIPAELVESEFFGHKKGAFTGAVADKQGLFQAAEGGTLFLDEVADLPLMMQVKLLRAIQEKAVRPVGGHEEISVDVRILSATHKNLAACVRDGQFREDLFYRLNVIELNVPPLRERQADIPQLADHILTQLAATNKMAKPVISAAAMQQLQTYHFPGNVRELENILERALTWAEDTTIDVDELMLPKLHAEVRDSQSVPEVTQASPANASVDLESQLEDQERKMIMQALESTRWNKTAAAKKLGITFRALRYKLKKLDLD
jgi:two-component system response regulator PilR (NtrC family)